MTTTTFHEIAERASGYSPVRALLILLAAPFYILGLVAAVLWVAGTWVWAAGVQGFTDARSKAAASAVTRAEPQ